MTFFTCGTYLLPYFTYWRNKRQEVMWCSGTDQRVFGVHAGAELPQTERVQRLGTADVWPSRQQENSQRCEQADLIHDAVSWKHIRTTSLSLVTSPAPPPADNHVMAFGTRVPESQQSVESGSQQQPPGAAALLLTAHRTCYDWLQSLKSCREHRTWTGTAHWACRRCT